MSVCSARPDAIAMKFAGAPPPRRTAAATPRGDPLVKSELRAQLENVNEIFAEKLAETAVQGLTALYGVATTLSTSHWIGRPSAPTTASSFETESSPAPESASRSPSLSATSRARSRRWRGDRAGAGLGADRRASRGEAGTGGGAGRDPRRAPGGRGGGAGRAARPAAGSRSGRARGPRRGQATGIRVMSSCGSPTTNPSGGLNSPRQYRRPSPMPSRTQKPSWRRALAW